MMDLFSMAVLAMSPTEALAVSEAQECSDQPGWELVRMGDFPPEGRFRGPARITINYDIDSTGRIARAEIAHQYGRADTLEMMATQFGQSVFAATSETVGPVINCSVSLTFGARRESDTRTGISDASQTRARDRGRHGTWHMAQARRQFCAQFPRPGSRLTSDLANKKPPKPGSGGFFMAIDGVYSSAASAGASSPISFCIRKV